MRDMVERHSCIALIDRGFPFIERQEGESCGLAQPRGDLFGVAAERESARGNDVEGLAHSCVAVSECADEGLGDVVGVDVMDRLHAEVWQCEFAAGGEHFKHVRIEVALRIDRVPTWADEVAGMQHRDREVRVGFMKEIVLDSLFADAVVAEGLAQGILGGRNFDGVTMDPDGATVEEVAALAIECLDELTGAVRRVTGEVDDGVGVESEDAFAEGASGFFCYAVEVNIPDVGPRGVIVVGLPFSSANAENCIAGLIKAHSEVAADVARATYDDNAHDSFNIVGSGLTGIEARHFLTELDPSFYTSDQNHAMNIAYSA